MSTMPTTPYAHGYLAAIAGKPKQVPTRYLDDEKAWLEGYEHGLRASIETTKLPGGRPTLTR